MGGDLTGWLGCCDCAYQYNQQDHGRTCPDCFHQACGDCMGGGPGSFEAPLEAQRTADNIPSLLYIERAKPRAIDIILNGCSVEGACADTGCEVNCLSRCYALKVGAEIVEQIVQFELPVEGKTLTSYGVTSIKCEFPRSPTARQTLSFHVFDRILVDVILGRRFLRQTRTLDVYKERLRPLDEHQGSTAIIRSLGTPQEQLICWIDEYCLSSFPDTGSQVNLLSRGFARNLKARIRNDQSTTIEFADGSSSETDGTIETTVSFYEPKSFAGTIHILDESQAIRPGIKLNNKSVSTCKFLFRETFHVLKGLKFDAILGETLLESVDAYVQHKLSFSLSPDPTVPRCLAPFRINHRAEGNGIRKSPLTEKQALINNYQVEQSRYQQRLSAIERKYSQDSDSKEALDERRQAMENHLSWWTANRELLKHHYSSAWYDENVPKLSS